MITTVHDRVVDHASRISVLTITIELQGVERGSGKLKLLYRTPQDVKSNFLNRNAGLHHAKHISEEIVVTTSPLPLQIVKIKIWEDIRKAPVYSFSGVLGFRDFG